MFVVTHAFLSSSFQRVIYQLSTVYSLQSCRETAQSAKHPVSMGIYHAWHGVGTNFASVLVLHSARNRRMSTCHVPHKQRWAWSMVEHKTCHMSNGLRSNRRAATQWRARANHNKIGIPLGGTID